MTLLWRATESRRSDRLFVDAVAEAAADLLPAWPPSAASQVFADLVALRTLQMDEEVAAAVSEGVDQIVILGAGIDTRFWRVPVPSAARIIEIDSDAVNSLAQRVLPAGMRRRIEARIPAGVPDALHAAEHDPGHPTLWIAEGLLEYLPGRMWERLVGVLTTHSAPGSRALVTVLGDELPSRFAHDPTFPFPRLAALSQILEPLGDAWDARVVVARPLREVPPDAFVIMTMRRL